MAKTTSTTTRTTTSDGPIAPEELTRLRRSLLRWYREHGRHELPWRLTRDHYAVLVSEVMLQQTQVDRVRDRYEAWLERWPTAQSLADAPVAEVIREWSGLGYNRRAVNLQRAAREACEQFGGIPKTEAQVRTLPGIGPYTAAAVACFAGGRRTPTLDTNVGRVIARVLLGQERAPVPTSGHVQQAALDWLPTRGARDHQLALMDLGAKRCKSRNPVCVGCPLARSCRWLQAGKPAAEPQDANARLVPAFETTARFARGRIVAMLALAAPMTSAQIARRLPHEHRAACGDYLKALAKDGLVAGTGNRWTLPENDQGVKSIASPNE